MKEIKEVRLHNRFAMNMTNSDYTQEMQKRFKNAPPSTMTEKEKRELKKGILRLKIREALSV